MTQFSSEGNQSGDYPVPYQNRYSNDPYHQLSNQGVPPGAFVDSPSMLTEVSKPPTMTLHLSNVMSHGPYPQHNIGVGPAGGLSSVNTTSHNLCTTTNNTML
jgi:hypothetical protein